MAITISVIDKKTCIVLLDLCSPVNPKDKKFEQLCELLQQHFKPKRLVVAESYRFHRCFQEGNETVQFTTPVWDVWRWLAIFLFVCGIRNPATLKKLLNKDQTFQLALEVAIADEIAVKESVQVQQQLAQSVKSICKNSSVSSCSSVDSEARPTRCAAILAYCSIRDWTFCYVIGLQNIRIHRPHVVGFFAGLFYFFYLFIYLFI